MEAQRTSLREQFNNRYLFISAGKACRGAAAGAVLLRRLPRSAAGATFFLLRILEKRSAIPQHWRRYLGNIEVRSMLCWSSFSACWPRYLWLSWAFSLFPSTRCGANRWATGRAGVIRHLSVDCRLTCRG